MSADEPFDVVALAVASARDVLEAPPVYGAFRLLDVAARVAAAAADDEFLLRFADDVARCVELVMRDQAAFAARVDELLAAVAAEALRRNGVS